MEKVIRSGKVAVLVSGGYGAGWFSWNRDKPEILFHPRLIEAVEKGEDTIDEIVKSLGLDFYTGGKDGLYIEWVPLGTQFRIDEYDGAESIILSSEETWITA